MNQVYSDPVSKSKIALTNFTCADGRSLLKDENLYKIIWAMEPIPDLIVDGFTFKIDENQIVFCTPLNVLEISPDHNKLMSIVFNKEFYCIYDNDIEVSCNGFLFYGSSSPVLVDLDDEQKKAFNAIYEVLSKEFEIRDATQGEMLRAMLKRLLIKSTRLAKNKLVQPDLSQDRLDIIRKFNLLVEKNYKRHHKVTDYAGMLCKSPKTLSNIFSKYSEKTPLKTINERIVLEARRLLLFSDRSVQEISDELGYTDESHFCKFFTKNNGRTPIKFKKESLSQKDGKNIPF